MSLLEFFFKNKKPSAKIAKERLQIILAHQRGETESGQDNSQSTDWLMKLQDELIEVITKYIHINKDDLKVSLEKKDNLELLEINVTIPENDKLKRVN